MDLEKQIKRKFLPLLGNIGSIGALAFSIYYAIFPESAVLWMVFCFIVMLVGTLSGMIIVEQYEKKGKDIVRADYDNVRILLQPAYIFAVIPFVILLLVGLISTGQFLGSFLGYAFLPTVFFILGIGNGIFDYIQTAHRKMLYVALIPLAISLFIAFISSPFGFYQDPVWLFGSIYLLFFLLVINRIKIEDMFVQSKKVNVENKKTIRRRNDFFILIFFVLYLIIFVIRNTFTKMSDWIIRTAFAVINWIINQFYKLYKEIDVEEVTQVAEDVIEDGPPAVTPPLNPVARTIFIVIASLVIAIVIFFLVKKIIQLIRWITGKVSDTVSTGVRKKKEEENEEFEEIVEDLDKKKEKSKFRRAPKFKYTLSGLKQLDTYKEKVRYLYGFALERLIIKKIEISKADTPEQILEKLKQQEHGDEFANDMFDEFTDEYINVRYGDKVKKQEDSLDDKVDMLDRGINKIRPNKKEN